MFNKTYNPDVLTCLANLSSDEVFTPPHIVNQILDLLPQELFRDKNTTFLDPVCKSGVFLREIAKRLMEGLKDEIPDDEERRNHIFKNQLYGIGITELTALLSRRSVYCSKTANGEYSVAKFDDEQGNVKFERIEHSWVRGKCSYCGANQNEYERDVELETHAYQFIHTDNPETIFNMRFDVIIGNPPYQLSDGGNNASATPIYNLFVEKSKQLNPQFLLMIIPARWYAGGRGLGEFRRNMLTDNHLMEIHDFKDASDCFPGIRVGGGICYFLWNKNYDSEMVKVVEHSKGEIISTMGRPTIMDGLDIFIRDSKVYSILEKVKNKEEAKMSSIVLTQKPYGLRTDFVDFNINGDTKVYTKKNISGYSYMDRSLVTKNEDTIQMWKLVTSRSTSVPEEDNGQVLRTSQTFIAEPNSVVTESYVVVGAFEKESDAINCFSYLKTKFFRQLCQVSIVSPDVSPRIFNLIPIQDFSVEWNDEKLYKKYNLSDDEINHIEMNIRSYE